MTLPPRLGARRRRLARGLTALPVALALALALHLGWARDRLGGARPWEVATGWRRIPGAPRPRPLLPVAPGDAVSLHWLGHSGFVLSWHGTRLLLDPHLGARCAVSPRLLERPLDSPGARLPRIDAALVSHAHYDHLDLPTLARVPGLPTLVLPAGSERYAWRLERRGTRVLGLAAGESVAVGDLRVTAVPARHNGSRHHPLGSRRSAVGWVIEGGEAAVYFAGDTGYGPHFVAIGERYRPALAVLPIGAYSPAFPVGLYHLSPEQAVRAAVDLGAGGPAPRVVPCHFGTFVLSLDRPDAALPRFARAAARAGVRWSMPALLGQEEP